MRPIHTLFVSRAPGLNATNCLLKIGGRIIPCKIGAGGFTHFKREGDKKTPVGRFKIRYGFFRRDRMMRPNTQLPMRPIQSTHGWCDAPDNANYNRLVRLPFTKSHEKMQRDDGLYNICLVLDYNMHPRTRNAGSAIFFHCTRKERTPTLGCIAIDEREMQRLLPRIKIITHIVIF